MAGAKLILVLGHTRCGAVTAAIDLICAGRSAAEATGCAYLDHVVQDVQQSVDPNTCRAVSSLSPAEKGAYVNDVARRNVLRGVERIRQESRPLDRLAREGRVAVVGAMYDVGTGRIEFLTTPGADPVPAAPG